MTKVEQQVECAACTWNKNCIEPPPMTKEEVEAKLEESKAESKGEGSVMGDLMLVMFFGSKDRECHVCPVFAEVLKSSPDLSQRIKSIMQES